MATRIVQVKSLRESAFEVVYKELNSEFEVIFQKKTKENNVTNVNGGQGPPATESTEDYVLTQAERTKALDDLRVKLDENLIGPYSEERQKIVDQFIKGHNKKSPSEVDYNSSLAFFNCLLDNSFTNFNLTGDKGFYHPFPDFNPSELLSIITQQSPDLQTLNLSFQISTRWAPYVVPSLCTSLKTFKLLTSLSLACASKPEIDYLPFFTALGESCPKLIKLHIDTLDQVRFHHLIALVLGKRQELLPQQFIDQLLNADPSSLAHLQFTPQSVTPICSTLQQLNLGSCLGYQEIPVDFILRHFPILQQCLDTSGGVVRLLHQQQQQQLDVASEPTTFQRSSEELGLIEWAVNAPFHGTLKD